jgi:NAD(P)-dependent dehydrogenase (short-subunit alcohol dehydrogenase family)
MGGWLEDKVALVVGGGSGIGRAVVDEFLGEGASVAVLELNEDKVFDLTQRVPEVLAMQGDATAVADNERAVEKTLAEFGRLDTLALFVGVFDWYTPLCDIPLDELDSAFEEIFTTNVRSHLIATKIALPALAENRGSIVFTISTSGFYPGRGGPLYVASKFALRGLVVQLAHELAPEIRVNGVAPGGTLNTDLRGLRSIGLQDRRLDDKPGRNNDLESRSPLGVALTANDHAGAYAFLASDRARGITGVIVNSDGGIGVRG